MKIQLINGPSLNLLGQRQPEIYGRMTLKDIESQLTQRAEELSVMLDCFQSNHEGDLIEKIHHCRVSHDAIIINPAAYSHTSVALLDALNSFPGRVIEVHLSNIHKREGFRHFSYVSSRADGVIAGLGARGYLAAMESLADPSLANR